MSKKVYSFKLFHFPIQITIQHICLQMSHDHLHIISQNVSFNQPVCEMYCQLILNLLKPLLNLPAVHRQLKLSVHWHANDILINTLKWVRKVPVTSNLSKSFVQPICPTIFSLSYPFHIISPEGATLLSGHQPRQWYQVQESVYNALQLRVTTSRKLYDWLWGLSRRATLPSLTTLQGDWPASSWCTTRPAPLKVKYCLFYSSCCWNIKTSS